MSSKEIKKFTNTTGNIIPAGYWKDARGTLSPESPIKPADKERDALVKAIVERAKPLQKALRDFKQHTFADIQALVDLSAEQYGATIGGKKAMSPCTTMTASLRFSVPCKTALPLMSVSRPLKS